MNRDLFDILQRLSCSMVKWPNLGTYFPFLKNYMRILRKTRFFWWRLDEIMNSYWMLSKAHGNNPIFSVKILNFLWCSGASSLEPPYTQSTELLARLWGPNRECLENFKWQEEKFVKNHKNSLAPLGLRLPPPNHLVG